MSRIVLLVLLIPLILAACAVEAPVQVEETQQPQQTVTMYKPPT